jgi:hypothetical protein
MLTKNVVSAPKNVDEKMLTTVKKMLTKKYSQHFRKMWIKKILTTVAARSKHTILGPLPYSGSGE